MAKPCVVVNPELGVEYVLGYLLKPAFAAPP